MYRRLIRLMIAASALASSPLIAATTISFTGGNGSLSTGGATFTSTDGSNITATVTAWNATLQTTGTNIGKYVVTQASLGSYVDGLGITSAANDTPNGCNGTLGGCGAQQIDNAGNALGSTSIDFLQLSFSTAVTLNSFQRSSTGIANGTTGLFGGANYDYDDDFSYGTGLAITSGAVLTSLTSLLQTNVGGNGTCGGLTAGLLGCNDTSTLTAQSATQNWYLGASIASNYGGDSYVDSFKAQALTLTAGTPAAVPETSTWTMMILGFGGIGYIVRRRSSGLKHLLSN